MGMAVVEGIMLGWPFIELVLLPIGLATESSRRSGGRRLYLRSGGLRALALDVSKEAEAE